MSVALDVIIVNWNAGQHLRNCLASIVDTNKSGFDLKRVVIVDNASSDSSMDSLEEFDLPMVIIHNQQNRGFAAACNQGARGSHTDYLLFLNPDTCLFRDTLLRSIHFMRQAANADIGICGVKLVNEAGEMVTSCARFPTLRIFVGKMTGLSQILPGVFPRHLMTSEECRYSSEVDQVIGAFFLVRRSVFNALSGFDERFFVYFEEVDFSLRAKQIGFSSYYLADVSLYHKGAVSSEQARERRLFYSLRSRIQYGFKNYPFLKAAMLLVLTITLEPIARILASIVSLSKSRLSETIFGYYQLGAYYIGKSWK